MQNNFTFGPHEGSSILWRKLEIIKTYKVDYVCVL